MIARRTPPIGPDKATFHRYLDDFSSVDDEHTLLRSLAECTDALPACYVEMLGLPLGSTYRDAIKLLLCRWTTTWRARDEHSID